jgi:hypothetical protein
MPLGYEQRITVNGKPGVDAEIVVRVLAPDRERAAVAHRELAAKVAAACPEGSTPGTITPVSEPPPVTSVVTAAGWNEHYVGVYGVTATHNEPRPVVSPDDAKTMPYPFTAASDADL